MSIKISIITPFYNPTHDDVRRSSESVNNQTVKDFEWILVDDGSTNREVEGDIRLGRNYGPSVARNVGFEIASGGIITYLDMGDEIYTTRVETLISLFNNYDIDLNFCGYNIIYPNNTLEAFNPFNYIGRTHSAYDYMRLLKNQNISIPLGAAHRRKIFVEVGGFQRGIVCGEDGVTWRRMVDKLPPTKVMFTDDMAGNYYISTEGQSRTQRRFEMGGFAIDGELMDNGRYLDNYWYENFTSDSYYE